MSELVERLRNLARDDAEITTAELIRYAQAMTDAADRITRLEADRVELIQAVEDARAALHQHFVDWDGEPEDAVPLQFARFCCDETLTRIKGE